MSRIVFFGLTADDILLYLSSGVELMKRKRADLSLNQVRLAVGELDSVPTDLADLLWEIQRLSASFGGRLTF